MREQIKKILDKYASVQVNLASNCARDMIVQEICDAFEKNEVVESPQPISLQEILDKTEDS